MARPLLFFVRICHFTTMESFYQSQIEYDEKGHSHLFDFMKFSTLFHTFVIACIFFIASLLLVDRWIAVKAVNRIYTDTTHIPTQSVGLVLGTSKYIAKSLNPYYTARIEGAISLFQDKKIHTILEIGRASCRERV